MKERVFSVQYSVLSLIFALRTLNLGFGSLLFLILTLFGNAMFAQEGGPVGQNVRFSAVDIYLDSGSATLAAYQVEFSVTNGVGKIVGIEGGDHQAFRGAPHYDPKAIQNERAIIAAFSLLPANALPSGRTRVATVHLMITGDSAPQFELKVQTAADAAGEKIGAVATFQKKETK